MSVALLPQAGNEMDDSLMQEDHTNDVTIAIDMESPTQHDVTPQGMAFSTTPAVQAYWTSTQDHTLGDQVVDIEFEAPLEDGMMSTGEVEMNTAPLYGEEYEYEMAYDGGNSETIFVAEESDVVDTELVDATEAHQPHVEGDFTPFASVESEHSHPVPLVEPLLTEEALVEVATSKEPDLTAEVVSLPREALQDAEVPVVDDEAIPRGEESPATEEATAPVAPLESVSPTTKEPESTAPVLAEAPVVLLEETDDNVTETAPVIDANSAADAPPTVVAPAEEYTADGYEETEGEERFDTNVTPILLTTFSEISGSSGLLTLFKQPDLSLIPSSSTATGTSPVLLLDQHQALYAEPIATLLLHLRRELLEAQPHVIPPSEFEYKEIQLVARDLQLTLTEDNIYAREITLFDLVSMHRSCGLSGYLHFDLSLSPRFIDRYRAIRQAIDNHANAQPAGTTDPVQTSSGESQPTANEEESSLGSGKPKDGNAQEGEAHEDDVPAEPPLPPDEEEEGDEWSEEQEEYQEEANPENAGNEDAGNVDASEWTHAEGGDSGGGAIELTTAVEQAEETLGEEEYVHEDEFVPGDDLPYPGGDYTDGGEEYDEAQDLTEDADADAPADEQEYQEEPTNEETTTSIAPAEATAADEGEATRSLSSSKRAYFESLEQDTTAEEYESNENEGVYNEDYTEEWDEEEYQAGADELEPPPLNETPTPFLQETTTEPVLSEVASEGATTDGGGDLVVVVESELPTSNGLTEHAHSAEPTRKRSFSEVDEEPEYDDTHSPGLKKPRHA
ncbi:hypothetical protein FRC17_001924 [Serendipita sp. 399]|nr:hypothetical protein FRC17_001924 [Serendipita sp. 399]